MLNTFYNVAKSSKCVDLKGLRLLTNECKLYSTVQAFFHQPAHPRGEGATIKRICPPRKPPAGGDCGGSAAFPRWVLQIKIDGPELTCIQIFLVSAAGPRGDKISGRGLRISIFHLHVHEPV